MVSDPPIKDWATFTVHLHPTLVSFLEARCRKSGRPIEAEAVCVVGEGMELAEIAPTPTSTRFQCSEEVMAQKAECKDCGDRIRHNACLWAQRHVQNTGHEVKVSLYLDFRDGDWLEKLTPERRAELDEVRNGDGARSIALGILGGRPH